ncbi:MAG: hypothetical protein K2N77_01825 [Lachnospiraceae bacterium]|nr:hypothetical protein [Lachnospiraceae bacterium]
MNESTIRNRRILIKNTENGEIIADTKILGFNSLTNSVRISAASLPDKKYYRITAFIFAEECLYELSGTIKGAMVDNEIEVLLGRSKEKEDRARTRYPVELKGVISHIIVDGQAIRLRKPMHIRTINMSANGVLMKADAGCFVVGDGFVLTLMVERGTIVLHCGIVRVNPNSMLTEEYGCRISGIQLERETQG